MRSTQKKAIISAVVFGVYAGIMRGLSLILCFDEKHLPTSNGWLSTLIIVLLLLGAAGTILARQSLWRKMPEGAGMLRVNGLTAGVSAAFCMFGAAVMRFAAFLRYKTVWGLLISLIFFFSVFSLFITIYAMRGRKRRPLGIRLMALVPVFAVAAETIELYRSVTRMPSGLYYAADVVACAVCGLLLFSVCGLVFRQSGVGKACTMSVAWFALGLPNLIGRLMGLMAGKGTALDFVFKEAGKGQGRMITFGGICTLDWVLIFCYAAATVAAVTVCNGLFGKKAGQPNEVPRQKP